MTDLVEDMVYPDSRKASDLSGFEAEALMRKDFLGLSYNFNDVHDISDITSMDADI